MRESAKVLLLTVGAQVDSGGDKAALYTAVSTILVAFIGAMSALLVARFNSRSSKRTTAATRVARHNDALERFLIARRFDPRKIKTGYESDDEVRRAV